MRVSTAADYAVLLVSALAAEGGVRATVGSLSARTGIPAPTVNKLVGQLVRAQILASSRGVSGGVRLAREAADISLADIVEAIEEPIALTTCLDADVRHRCVLDDHCRIRARWSGVSGLVRDALASVPLTAFAPACAALAPEPTP